MISSHTMCGRFTYDIPAEFLLEHFGVIAPPAPPRYNVAPTQQICVIRQDASGGTCLHEVRWGLVPSWAKDLRIGVKMINARSESVHEKPAFRGAIRYRRCLIPTSGFYEWQRIGKAKFPFLIRLKDGSPTVFAGIWESWRSVDGETIESCAILTTSANKLIEQIHDRMPVILHPEEFERWLDRTITDPKTLSHLYQSYPADLMEMYEVSQMVNSSSAQGVDLIQATLPM